MSQVTEDDALRTALRHHRGGDRQQAETLYKEILARDPEHADAMHFLGVLAHQSGQNKVAFDLIRRSISLQPKSINAFNNLALVLRSQGRLDDATLCARRALELSPRSPELHYNLGSLLKSSGHIEEAIESYARAVELKPKYPDALNNLSAALLDSGRFQEAIGCCRRALALDPNHAAAFNNLGNALKLAGDRDGAIEAYTRAVELHPEQSKAHNNLGVALKDAGRYEEALACFQKALILDPTIAESHNNLGATLQAGGRIMQAMECFKRAIHLRPEYPEANNNLAMIWKDLGQLDEAVACLRRALNHKPVRPGVHSNLIYTLLYHRGYDQAALSHELQRWNALHGRPLAAHIRPHENDPSPERRLKIGYVSPDFRNHCAASFLLPTLSRHNHEEFEIHCFASVARPDGVTARFIPLADRFHQVSPFNDAELAEIIRAEGIDILVDLTLHMANNRLLTFARKPAPVQITWLGYPGSTGLAAMDYRLTDPHLDPPLRNDRFCTERSIRLPETFWCYDPMADQPDVNPLPAPANGFVTFGCLNNFCKVNEPTLRLWADAMRHAPRSRLMLLAPQGSRQTVLDILASEDISYERVQFVNGCPRADYLRLYQQIDIALDTYPYNGHTTSLDALWMGVPVISLCGPAPVSRAGFSQLRNLSLGELVAQTDEHFIQIAAKWSADLPLLAELRAGLRQRMENSPLMNAAAFTVNLEKIYRDLWRRWCDQRINDAG
jgi:predicted O-linked N-acetylglucosamine transferase (SPINDLY family)